MNRVFRRRPVLRWLALVVACVGVLGHVCALPHEAHAGAVEPSESHDRHDEHSDHDALHAASCEAVPSTVTPAALVVPAAHPVIVTAVAAPARGAIYGARPAAIDTSPPLFLLHSALRI